MIIIPSSLPGILEPTGLTRIQQNNIYKLVGYVIIRYTYHRESFTEPIPISQKHFRANLGTHYNDALQAVKELGILCTNDKYYFHPGQSIKGECKKYLLNPSLVVTDPELQQLELNAVKSTGDFQTVRTSKLLGSVKLSIDSRKILKTASKYALNQFNNELIKVNGDIPEGFYKIPGRKTALKLSILRERAEQAETDLIFYRSKCYFDTLPDFQTKKIYDLTYRYATQLVGIKNITNKKFLVCRRNDTNGRLDTNLTNLKSSFLPYLKFFGSTFVSLDLCNSQFTIFFLYINSIFNNLKFLPSPSPTVLTHFFKKRIENSTLIDCKSITYRRLETSVKNGKLYEYAAEKIEQETGEKWSRNLVKKTMFEVLFSSYRNRSRNKKILKKVLPELVFLTDTFKLGAIEYFKSEGLIGKAAEKKGNNFLPVFLQRAESNIFIDTILSDLLKKNIKVFTKHDSIICRQEDFINTFHYTREHLDNIFGVSGYTLKPENKKF